MRANGSTACPRRRRRRRLGIVTAGKAYLDVRQALEELGIDEARRELGLSRLQGRHDLAARARGRARFADGLEDLLVSRRSGRSSRSSSRACSTTVERRPGCSASATRTARRCVPAEGELRPPTVARGAARLARAPASPTRTRARCARRPRPQTGRRPGGRADAPARFCSGCPHNTSTVVPDDSPRPRRHRLPRHGGVAARTPHRSVTQMGGEGANWIGQAPLHRAPARLPEHGGRHLLPLGPARDPRPCVAAKCEHHLQGARQRRGGDDRRPTHRGRGAWTARSPSPRSPDQLRGRGRRSASRWSDEPEKVRAADAASRRRPVHHRDELDARAARAAGGPGVTA